jgi:hypothetical protein
MNTKITAKENSLQALLDKVVDGLIPVSPSER